MNKKYYNIMITWKFENSPVAFKSKEENLERDIFRMRKVNFIDPQTKINIINGTINKPLSADAIGGDGNTSVIPQSTLSVDSTETKTRKSKTSELSSVSSDVVYVDPNLNSLDVPSTPSDTEFFGDLTSSESDR